MKSEFYEQLMDLFGEVPIETIVRKIKAEIGDEDGDIRQLMGHMAFTALCASQDTDPLGQQRFQAILEVLMALGGFTAASAESE